MIRVPARPRPPSRQPIQRTPMRIRTLSRGCPSRGLRTISWSAVPPASSYGASRIRRNSRRRLRTSMRLRKIRLRPRTPARNSKTCGVTSIPSCRHSPSRDSRMRRRPIKARLRGKPTLRRPARSTSFVICAACGNSGMIHRRAAKAPPAHPPTAKVPHRTARSRTPRRRSTRRLASRRRILILQTLRGKRSNPLGVSISPSRSNAPQNGNSEQSSLPPARSAPQWKQ